MGYKLLGFAVWQGAKWYVRRRYGDTRLKLAAAGIAGLLFAGAVAGAVAVQRKPESE